jgi:SAM-dependent methyltransferase
MSSAFKDHFSGHAAQYAQYRPQYPESLFEWLSSLTVRHDHAWDCGTGNGQAARGLTRWFGTVTATDASADQIQSAEACAHVEYRVAKAEGSGLESGSIDLVTVAQALHWFNLDQFYPEVRRVARPGAVFAGWCYGLSRIAPEVDAVIEHLYTDIVGTYWPPERRYIEEQFRTLAMPFPEIPAPSFAMRAEWPLPALLGYLGTWSAVQAYRRKNGTDPLAQVADDLAAAWGPADSPRRIDWPLYFRVGRIEKRP